MDFKKKNISQFRGSLFYNCKINYIFISLKNKLMAEMSRRENSSILAIYERRGTVNMNVKAGSMGEDKPTAVSSSSSSSSYISRLWSSALRTKTLASSSPYDVSARTVGGDALVRRLGLLDLILIGVGASVGAGIFVITGTVARDAGPGEFVLV